MQLPPLEILIIVHSPKYIDKLTIFAMTVTRDETDKGVYSAGPMLYLLLLQVACCIENTRFTNDQM